jgi:hypothetical protein
VATVKCHVYKGSWRSSGDASGTSFIQLCSNKETYMSLDLYISVSCTFHCQHIVLWLQGDNKSIPDVSTWDLSPESKYVHYCDNETIQGVEFMSAPAVGDKLLCGDFSSDFLSKPIDVQKYAVVYGGASSHVM